MNIVVNADDFGWSKSCTDAILQSFEKGYITTTTMCCNGEAFDYAVEQVTKTEYKDRIGIHFVLTEGRPLTEAIRTNPGFCDEKGLFHGKIARYRALDKESRRQVLAELTAQAQRFADSGLAFHHADSHHHIHTAPVITPLVCKVMKQFGIKKLRIHRNIGTMSSLKKSMKQLYNLTLGGKKYSALFGSFEDVKRDPAALQEIKKLEIMCHPDLDLEGVLVDRAGAATYDAPYGTPMVERNALISERN